MASNCDTDEIAPLLSLILGAEIGSDGVGDKEDAGKYQKGKEVEEWKRKKRRSVFTSNPVSD